MSETHSFLRVSIEGVTYKIPVMRPHEETLRDVCNEALIQHLTDVLDFSEDEATSAVEDGSLKVVRVQEEDGTMLGMRRSMAACHLQMGAVLRASIKATDDELLQRIRKAAQEFVRDSSLSGSSAGKSSVGTNDSKTAHSEFSLTVQTDHFTKKIGVLNPSDEILKDICNKAIIGYIKEIYRLNDEDAVQTVEKKVSIIWAEVGGKSVELNTTVQGNNISNGATISIVIDGIEVMIPNSPMESLFSSSQILAATNRYSKDNIVGDGGQAIVYKGSLFGSLVAVKKYLSVEFIEMELEVKVLQKVRHKNVVTLMGCCVEEKCIVSEFMEGGTLQDRLKSGSKFTWAEKYHTVQEMISAVHYLHNCNILHRDLKPANVLFDCHGTAKIADMGLAKLSAKTVSASGICGTIGYMAPEYLQFKKTSRNMDVYAIGLIILQLCTNKPRVEDIHGILSVIDDGGNARWAAGVKLMRRFLVAKDGTLPQSKMEDLLEIGLQCSERSSNFRPNLRSVLKRLGIECGDEAERYSEDGPKLPVEDSTLNANIRVESQEPPMSTPKTLEELLRIAGKGDSNAQFAVAQIYAKKVEDWGSKREAVKWYDKASRQGHKEASAALNSLLESVYASLGKPSMITKEETKFIKDLANDGIPIAQFYLGKCYHQWDDIQRGEFGKDGVSAVEWYTRAAEQGDMLAQNNLSYCYNFGIGVKKDEALAVKWCSKAAEQGNAFALNNLGYCYEFGIGVEKDMATAVKWYSKAADEGYGDAQNKLGYCYYYGSGVEKDVDLAVKWFTIADEQGCKVAKDNLAKLKVNASIK